MGRSKSRSLSRSRSRSPRRSSGGRKSPSKYEMDNDRKIYIGGLRRDADEKELERIFSRYGSVHDVWVARSPPGFGFIELEDPSDAKDAIRDLDGTMMCGVMVRVSHSCSRRNLPSIKNKRRPFDVRCYECGEFGHYAYECRERTRRARAGSNSRSRSRSPKRRSRSPGRRGRYRSRSRSGSRGRRDRSRSGSRSRKGRKNNKDRKSGSRSPSPADSDDGKKKKNYRKKQHDSDSEDESPKKDKGKEKGRRDRKKSDSRH